MKEESIRELSCFQQYATKLSEQGIWMKAAEACIVKELLEADKQLPELELLTNSSVVEFIMMNIVKDAAHEEKDITLSRVMETIEELASVCHFSQTHFMNFFKRYAGMTCIEYINHYRITRAAADLVETERQGMDIALENGFRNISYFNKVFKKIIGISPSKYRSKAVD